FEANGATYTVAYPDTTFVVTTTGTPPPASEIPSGAVIYGPSTTVTGNQPYVFYTLEGGTSTIVFSSYSFDSIDPSEIPSGYTLIGPSTTVVGNSPISSTPASSRAATLTKTSATSTTSKMDTTSTTSTTSTSTSSTSTSTSSTTSVTATTTGLKASAPHIKPALKLRQCISIAMLLSFPMLDIKVIDWSRKIHLALLPVSFDVLSHCNAL
ncbi:16550_t:CDS:2, partial [Acaulospora morrowiae]